VTTRESGLNLGDDTDPGDATALSFIESKSEDTENASTSDLAIWRFLVSAPSPTTVPHVERSAKVLEGALLGCRWGR
jgi:hypothetical protein